MFKSVVLPTGTEKEQQDNNSNNNHSCPNYNRRLIVRQELIQNEVLSLEVLLDIDPPCLHNRAASRILESDFVSSPFGRLALVKQRLERQIGSEIVGVLFCCLSVSDDLRAR